MIKLKYAENAVYAKVKALYGKRLTYRQYTEIFALHSVKEIAEYLKTKTVYSEIFIGLNPTEELQRSRLENLLFSKMYSELSSVERFQKAAGNSLYKYFIIKYDTDQLTQVLSSIRTKSDSYFFSFPVFYNEHSFLDLYKLAMAKNQEEIIEITKGTPYHEALKNAITDYRVTQNPLTVQAHFDALADREFTKIIAGEKKTSLPENLNISKLYKLLNDTELIKTLYRLTAFSLKSDDFIKTRITSFTKDQMQGLLSAKSPEELDEIIKTTYLSDIVTNKSGSDIYHSADNYVYRVFHKTVCRSTDANEVMFAYFHLVRNEIRNLIHIIEGKRYGVSMPQILPTLIIPDKESDTFGN